MKQTDQKKPMGHPTLFGPTTGGDRIQGCLTPYGSKCFEHARKHLTKLAKGRVARASDGNTVDFLARIFADGDAGLS